MFGVLFLSFLACLLIFYYRRLDAPFFNNFQDVEAEDFEQHQGERGKWILEQIVPTILSLSFTTLEARFNMNHSMFTLPYHSLLP
jgi:hypothetical protein